MRTLRDDVDLDGFFDGVAAAPARVLLLDYDGTMAPFVERRDQAVPYPGVREELRAHIDEGNSRLVVVSGRAVEHLRPLLGLDPPPEMWGNHGWERYVPYAGLHRTEPGREARRLLDRGLEVARERAPGERVEVKPVSVAVHTRGMRLEDAASLLEDVRARWSELAEGDALDLHAFDGGLELRVPGRDKGTAVREILETEPDEAAVAFLGDDRTDEDAFEALEGRALRVLVRSEPRQTAADLWIEPPDELLDFLRRWREAARRG